MTTVDLYPYLILVGSSILAGAGWLLYQYRTQTKRSHKLIRLNEDLEYDLPDFMRQCWQTLKDGGFSGMEWSLDWFGATIHEKNGQTEGIVTKKKFEVQEITLDIKLYHGKAGWEKRYFSNALAENFFLLVRMNLWIKLGTVKGAFDQSSKMAVFLQHDVKNMVQLVSLSADQLENLPPGQEEKVLESLKAVIPAVRDRAQNMLNALVEIPNDGEHTSLPLDDFLKQTANVYELPVKVRGSATVSLEKDKLQSILDNLLGNYARQSKKHDQPTPDLHIELRNENQQVVTTFEDKNGLPCLWPERLFEPFWSEHGTGLGIGLYQARQQVLSSGGSLTVNAPENAPLVFILCLPVHI